MDDLEFTALSPENRWSVGRLRSDDETLIVSWRPSLEEMAGHSSFATILGINYDRLDRSDSIRPGAVTFDDILEINGEVARQLEADAVAFVAYSQAGVDWRESIYYVRDLQLATERLAAVLSQCPNVHYAVWHNNDPEWSQFLFILNTFRMGTD